MMSSSLKHLLLLATVLAVPNVHALCPAGTIPGLSSKDCFILQPTPLAWQAAEESCVRAGGHLASVSSQLTNSFLLSKVVTQSCPAAVYWLGGSYMFQTSIWTWSDGRRFTYENWASGQPASDGDYCLSLEVTTGEWYSDRCGAAKPSLCRVPPLARSTPPSTTYCPRGWTYIPQTRKCYQIPKGYTSWNLGRAKCERLGGTLASIPNAAANGALFEFADKIAPYDAVHIGLYGGVGNWKWTDGTPVTYTNWKANYPGDIDGGCVDFHDTFVNDADGWYNIDCGRSTGFTILPLCQRDPGF